MKKFVLKQNGQEKPVGEYETKVDASEAMMTVIDEKNRGDNEIEVCLTPFDFTLEEIECKEINEIVKSYEDARKYLGGKPNADFTVVKKALSGNCVKLKDVAHLIEDINPRHIKALIALNELFTIAEAWNKADNFVPDFSNANQYKYYPWFVYNNDTAGFVYAATYSTAANANANFGSRLCFKTANRARQFGNKFADLYNQVFLFQD